ncbi:hypothetical protein [Caulobacter sp. FWC26]|uniref:hypothetical protein n=1 Tax=Caulobacter sp. FWC26 TaxID=69665 RepID=UPI000C15235C|nr:hypothetical protein [Caulobacter sp. FWC26]AZS19435.1 hypothetical protein CSW63_01445 [Caulobacter sp. FWC26]
MGNFAALLVTDLVISPIDLEDYSLLGIGKLRKQIKLVEDQARGGRRIDFLGLLPSRFVSTSPRQRENLKTLLTQGGTSLMFEGVLTQRQGYAEAVSLKAPGLDHQEEGRPGRRQGNSRRADDNQGAAFRPPSPPRGSTP